MKIEVKSIKAFKDKRIWIEYKSIVRKEGFYNDASFFVAECFWRLVDENNVELISFVPTVLKANLYQSWDGTDEHFGELLLQTLALEKIV